MKKVLLIAALGILLAAPSWAGNFGVFGAFWETKDADQGMGAGIKTRLGRFFDLRATYFSDVTADTSPESRDFEIKAVPLEAGFVIPFAEGQTFNPYAGAGAGYYFLDVDRGEIDDEAGWYGVIGADFGTSASMGFNVEAMYRNMEATVVREPETIEEIEDIDFDEDVKFDISGLAINAGLVWRF